MLTGARFRPSRSFFTQLVKEAGRESVTASTGIEEGSSSNSGYCWMSRISGEPPCPCAVVEMVAASFGLMLWQRTSTSNSASPRRRMASSAVVVHSTSTSSRRSNSARVLNRFGSAPTQRMEAISSFGMHRPFSQFAASHRSGSVYRSFPGRDSVRYPTLRNNMTEKSESGMFGNLFWPNGILFLLRAIRMFDTGHSGVKITYNPSAR